MHELTIAIALVEQIEEALHHENDPKLTHFVLEVGEYSGIEREALEFALPFAMRTSSFARAKFTVRKIPAKLGCNKCGKAFVTKGSLTIQCPYCESIEVSFLEGKDLILKSLEIE